jgi:hypothetical protein
MALRVAATLRLADFTPDDGAGEGAALDDLAERAGADPDALARMLRHLVQHGVFTEPRPAIGASFDATMPLRRGGRQPRLGAGDRITRQRRRRPRRFAEMNLRMLVLAGVRERTTDQYRALADAAGLLVTAGHDITERHVIIECVPI